MGLRWSLLRKLNQESREQSVKDVPPQIFERQFDQVTQEDIKSLNEVMSRIEVHGPRDYSRPYLNDLHPNL